VVFTFGRFQPPTSGHQLLIDKVVKEAKNRGAENRIYPSHSNDKKQNPLSHKDKVLYMRKMFPTANIVDDRTAKTPFQVLTALEKDGFNNVVMVVGGDRVSEFKTRMKKYTGAFDTFEVISAGERDPDAEGVVGMSGSKMRKAAVDRDFEKFLTGVPSRTPKRVSLKLFKSIRKGMGLKEEYMSFGEQTFDVRLADTDETRAKGLMNVKSMSDDDGMFFVFEEENYHGIWMKNTYIPLDVVWINESGTIVDIATLNPHDLNTRMPSEPAKYVLEVNAGTFSGKVGDKIGSVQLDERYRRQDVYAIVNRKGKVLSANLTKKNAHKEVTRHRDSIIVLDPDAKEGDNLKFFAKESVELNEQSVPWPPEWGSPPPPPAQWGDDNGDGYPDWIDYNGDGVWDSVFDGEDWQEFEYDEIEPEDEVEPEPLEPTPVENFNPIVIPADYYEKIKNNPDLAPIFDIIPNPIVPDDTAPEYDPGYVPVPDDYVPMPFDPKWYDNPLFKESVELNELSKEARRKMARAARRTSKRRAMKRKIKARRMKGSEDLKKKARKAALMGFKKKMLKGRSWAKLGHSEKEALEKRLKKKYKPARIARVAQKLLPGIRQSERERIARLKGNVTENRLLTEPDVLDSLVKKLKDKNPSWSDSKAYAIATASLQKRGILKKGTHDLAERNYKLEYANYQGKPEQIAKRSSRNKARRKLEAQGRVSKGDGKDVDHRDRNPLNNGDGNLRVKKKEHNRSFSRTNEGRLPRKNKNLEDGTDKARECYQAITPGQPVKKFTDIRKKFTVAIGEQTTTDRVKEKHKKENERMKVKHARELEVTQEREMAKKTRDKERALRMKRLGGG